MNRGNDRGPWRGIGLVVALLCLSASAEAGPFDQGRVRVALSGGSATSSGEDYFVIDYGAGYYLMDGLEVGLDVGHWVGGEPVIHKLSPGLRYTFHFLPIVTPYVGGFYKHWFIGDDVDDVDAIGGRLGVFILPGPEMPLVFGAGVVHEALISPCEEDCTTTYPEFQLSLSL